jgi:hypothetical protein
MGEGGNHPGPAPWGKKLSIKNGIKDDFTPPPPTPESYVLDTPPPRPPLKKIRRPCMDHIVIKKLFKRAHCDGYGMGFLIDDNNAQSYFRSPYKTSQHAGQCEECET